MQASEDAIWLEGVDSIKSQSREGSASVTIEVQDAAVLAEVLACIKPSVFGRRDLPEDVDPPTVMAATRWAKVASNVVTGPMSPSELKLNCD